MSAYCFVGALFVSLAMASAPMIARAENLVVFGDDNYPPVIYMNQGKAEGILPAIFARLSKDTGDTYELVLVPWKRALDESKRGHGGITNFSRNEDRDKFYDFSLPIYDDGIRLVVLRGKQFVFSDINDLKGKIVGGALGASFGDEVDRAIAAGFIVIERDPNQVSRMKKLLHERIDVALIGNDKAGFELLVTSDPELASNRRKFVVLPRPLVLDPLHLAFLKSMNMKPALERFNSALMKFKKTVEYRQLTGDIP